MPPPSTSKRAAPVPLTAGAFAFATPSPASKKPAPAARPIGSFTPFGIYTPIKQEPRVSDAPETPLGVKTEHLSRHTTPLRSLHTPTSHQPERGAARDLAQAGNKEDRPTGAATPRKLTSISAFAEGVSPFQQAKAPEANKKRRLGSIEFAIPPLPKPKPVDDGRKITLGAAQHGVNLDDIEVDEKKEVEREVGIGISPRKGKVKWTGRGEPPLSFRLSSLLSIDTSSTTLFYTSLHHTLNPSSRASKHDRESDTKTVTPVAPLSHIKTAPIHLVLLSPLSPRSHTAQMWRAAVRRWPATPLRLQLDEEEEEEDPPEHVIVNFTVGKDPRSTGADPRAVRERWRREGNDRAEGHEDDDDDVAERQLRGWWEVGVWSEWTDLGMAMRETGWDGVKREKMVFASRYLIAEDKGGATV